MTGGLEPLPGGASGETFVSEAGGERVVVRIYLARSAARGDDAPEVDASVLHWMSGLLPVPRVLEVRPGDAAAGVPGLLVTSFLSGRLLSEVLPQLDTVGLATVGHHLGTLLGRLAHVALPRPGLFRGGGLALEPLPPQGADLPAIVEDAAAALGDRGWTEADRRRLGEVAVAAQARLDTVDRSCLVHSDLNPKNLLVDPGSLAVTGVLDWEFAHAGSPYADLGNLLRHDRHPVYVAAVLEAREALVPDPRPDALDLARSADLVALVDLSARAGDGNPHAAAAAGLLRAVAANGDVHATPGAEAVAPLDSRRRPGLS